MWVDTISGINNTKWVWVDSKWGMGRCQVTCGYIICCICFVSLYKPCGFFLLGVVYEAGGRAEEQAGRECAVQKLSSLYEERGCRTDDLWSRVNEQTEIILFTMVLGFYQCFLFYYCYCLTGAGMFIGFGERTVSF